MKPVKLTKDPESSPHVCIKCRAHAQVRDWFVDIGTDVEWEGMLYICNECMKDIVRVTPDYLTVDAHREIVSEYIRDVDAYYVLKTELKQITDQWFEMTGLDLMTFFQNLKQVSDVRHELELSRIVSSATGSESTVGSDSSESEPDNGSPTESDRTVDAPIIAFS